MRLQFIGDISKQDTIRSVRRKWSPLEPKNASPGDMVYNAEFAGVKGGFVINAVSKSDDARIATVMFLSDTPDRAEADEAFIAVRTYLLNLYGKEDYRDYYTIGIAYNAPPINAKDGVYRITDYLWRDNEIDIRLDYYWNPDQNIYIVLVASERHGY